MALAAPNLHGLDSMSIAHARAALSEVVGRARHGKSPTVLTSRGKPVAAVVPIEDLELIEEAIDAAFAAKARARIAAGEDTIPWEQVKAALDAKPTKPTKRK
jgi:prevent-host-death family protein